MPAKKAPPRAAAPSTLAQRIEHAAQKAMEEFALHPYKVATPPPNRAFEVGQPVRVGRLQGCRIERILEEGRYLVVSTFVSPTRDNPNPPKTEEDRVVDVWACRDVQPAIEGTTHFRQKLIDLYYSQRDITGLIMRALEFGVDFDPPYQRGRVWELEDKQLLIDSMFAGADIGKFVFLERPFAYEQRDGRQVVAPGYEIVDGKQRLSALIEFFNDEFAFQGKRYSELSAGDQDHLRRYPVSVADLPKEKMSPADILTVFLRLNTGGKPQDPQHMQALREELAQLQVSASAPSRPKGP